MPRMAVVAGGAQAKGAGSPAALSICSPMSVSLFLCVRCTGVRSVHVAVSNAVASVMCALFVEVGSGRARVLPWPLTGPRGYSHACVALGSNVAFTKCAVFGGVDGARAPVLQRPLTFRCVCRHYMLPLSHLCCFSLGRSCVSIECV